VNNKNSDLHRLLQRAILNPLAVQQFRHQATAVLCHLGMEWSEAHHTVDICLSVLTENPLAAESNAANHADLFIPAGRLSERMKERSGITLAQFAQRLIPGSVLDLGGGSGEIASRVAALGHEVTVADVRDWRSYQHRHLPFTTVRDDRIDLPDRSIDTVLILMVLHHSENPEALLREAFRVAKQRVIIIESVTNTLTAYHYGCLMDWFYNHIVHYEEDPERKVPVPCNFLPAAGWEQLIWSATSLSPIVSQDLGVFQNLNPEHHHLLVYQT
jgi:SAM-dependent methyltransferase